MSASILAVLALSLPAATKGGELLVVSPTTDAVARFAPDGSFAGGMGTSTDTDVASAVAVGPDGRIYVASAALDQVAIFDAEGSAVDAITGTMDAPSALAFDPRGNLLVASEGTDSILAFDASGTVVQTYKTFAADAIQLDSPSSVAVAPSGNVLTTDRGNNLVFEFDASGKLLRTSQVGCGSGFDMCGLTLGWDGHVFVCCSTDHVVKELDENLQILNVYGSAATLATPRAIAFGSDGLMYVASSTGARVDKFDRSGAHLGSIDVGSQAVAEPSGLAFVPFRFGVTLKGNVDVDAGLREKINEKFNKPGLAGPVLSIDPGSGAAMLTVVDDAADAADLFDLLGGARVFRGLVPGTTGSPKERVAAGLSLPWSATASPALSLDLALEGKLKSGQLDPNFVKGTLVATGAGFTARVNATLVKALN